MTTSDETTAAALHSRGKALSRDATSAGLRRVAEAATVLPYIPRKRQERSGLLVEFLFSSAGQLGCDYLDFLLLGENRYGVMLADFSGKLSQDGIPLLQLTLRSKSASLSAAATLRYIDEHIARVSTNAHLVTGLYLIFDQSKRLLQYASAGHLPILLHRPLDNKTYLLIASGSPFGRPTNGATVDGLNSINGETITLRQNDLVVVYSSGLLNQRNRHGECFGRQRLIDFIGKYGELNPTQFLLELQRQLDAFTKDQPQKDDVAVIALKNTLRDLERPSPENVEHAIGGRFLCVEEEQVILETLRDHPSATMSEIADSLAARDLRHLGKQQVQTYLAHTAHWLVPPAANGNTRGNGVNGHQEKTTARFSLAVPPSKSNETTKQLQQDLVAAFPIGAVLNKKYEFRGHGPEVEQAMEFYNTGDYQKALFEFSRLRERIRPSAAVQGFFGNLYLLQNMIVKAKHEYQQALQLDPRYAHAHLALSYIALLQEELYAAIDELTTALRLDKNLQSYHSFLEKLISAVEKSENKSEWLL